MLEMVDWSFIVTLLVIMTGALISSYLRSSRTDRCLKDFDGFHVTVERKNNRLIWGTMRLFPTGFDIEYAGDFQDEHHVETSYIFYKDEFQDLQAIYRYARELSESEQARRAKAIQRSFHPNPLRRFGRSFRNFMNTASSSFSDALGLVVGRARKPAAKVITDTSETYVKNIGKDIIGYVGTSYDPLLEHYIGSRVVMEMVEDGEVHEHVGILKDYSADFLEVLDIFFPLPKCVNVSSGQPSYLEDKVTVALEDGRLRVHNVGDKPVHVETVKVNGAAKEVNAIVAGGEEIALHLGNDAAQVSVNLRVAARLDMIVPRSHALIRHRAERENPYSIFDIGLSLVRRQRDQKEIERLRQVLAYSPWDVLSAAKLGELLVRNGEFAEAEQWLLFAKERRHHLPDRGARVEYALHELQRHVEDVWAQNRMTAELSLSRSAQAVDDSFGVAI
ncbi:MAG: tetratricopeptide repeat protein [Caldilineales bacterium]|nr:tetratricopeptide repeat protein [Caldilineales bacterium]